MQTLVRANDNSKARRAGLSQWHQLWGMTSAVGGRALWRLWIPVAAYALTGVLSWIYLWASGAELGSYSGWPGVVIILSTPLWVSLLWLWGARFALSLGYARGTIFAFTWALTTLGPVGLVLFSSIAHMLEYRLGALRGLRVWAIIDGDKMGADPSLFNGVVIYFAMLASPLLIAISLGAIAWLRYSVAAAISVTLLAGALAFGFLILSGIVDNQPQFQNNVALSAPLPIEIVLGAFVGWRMFRRTPA